MKIEKLTENKIRIILNIEDLELNNIDFNSVLNNSPAVHTLLLSILNKAEEEIGFFVQDSKILIDVISSFDGIIIFTITKNPINSLETIHYSRVKPYAKRKSLKVNIPTLVYSFGNFEEFCEFCHALHMEFLSHENLELIYKNSALYFYNNNYYLLISEINYSNKYLNVFFSVISEFTDRIDNYQNFDSKLLEHGKEIFKQNAISSTIDLFVK